jgi:hypothetical protein
MHLVKRWGVEVNLSTTGSKQEEKKVSDLRGWQGDRCLL